jgi:hypothetical protein
MVAAGVGAGFSSILGGGDATPSCAAASQIPPVTFALQAAAASRPGMPWTILLFDR